MYVVTYPDRDRERPASIMPPQAHRPAETMTRTSCGFGKTLLRRALAFSRECSELELSAGRGEHYAAVR